MANERGSTSFERKTYPESFRFKSVSLYKAGDDFGKPYVNLHDGQNGMLVSFQYSEDIMWPSYGGQMVVVDNDENLISSMPIQGFERVVVEIDDLTDEGESAGIYTIEFRVHAVKNRVNTRGKQVYTLGLISTEGLLNEGIRVNSIQTGNTTTVVENLLTKYLKVPASKISSEASITAIKLLPTKKSPYSIIRSLLPRTISEKTGVGIKSGSSSGSVGADNITESDVNPQTAEKATGTAGYLFFQTNRGFNFKSIDRLVSDEKSQFEGDPVKGTFYYQAAKVGPQSLYKIQEVIYDTEIDMFKKLRQGAYASICCYFNINTGEYEERVYNLKDMWKDMAHLGSQDKLPIGQESLSKYPSRVMSTVINHENWYNDTKVASNEDKHGGDGENTFPDFQKNYLSQGIARAGILFNQKLTISITGHMELCAGDKIEIRIPEAMSEIKRDDAWDPEHSGTYLIKNLNHQFMTGATPKFHTVLELVRDSYGIKEKESQVT
tara:strand:+ start:9657 stop:11138 length:1482 start_codon:yes stop_codon:yes gene_type:complete